MDRTLEKRITRLNDVASADGRCVVYWMQSSLRSEDNPALNAAIHEANTRNQPLLVFFSIDRSIPSANQRNFTFILECLKETIPRFKSMGASVCMRFGDSVANVIDVSLDSEASLIVTDESHLNEGRKRRDGASKQVKVPMYQVDSNVVVPVREIPKEQYAAYTIRPRLHKLMPAYLKGGERYTLKNRREIEVYGDVSDVDVKKALKRLDLPYVPASTLFHGGESQAEYTLWRFIEDRLEGYAENRNHPELSGTSDMSPYLRFGNISPITMLMKVMESGGPQEDIDSFIEEAFVRRELAENFTFYDRNYRSFESLPGWAMETIDKHRRDERSHVFTLHELENASTGEDLWDASQYEMLKTGKMSNYMRMVWGKRVIEWTRTPEDALNILLFMNDKYEIDGRSPNGYTCIMWCFGKHDRAFGERPVLGKLRYMSPSGIKKKFSTYTYIQSTGLKEKAELRM